MHSIQSLLRDERGGWTEEVFIKISESEVGRAVRTRRWKYGVVAPEKDLWEDAGYERYMKHYLYDLEADPYELNNLVGMKSHQEVSATMRRRLLRRMVEAREEEPETASAEERPAGDAEQLSVPSGEASAWLPQFQ